MHPWRTTGCGEARTGIAKACGVGQHFAAMRIMCPACTASYDVPDALLGGGRSVRCVRCLREWQPGQPTAAPLPSVSTRAAWPDAAPPAAAGPDVFDAPDFDEPDLDMSDAGRPRFKAPRDGAPARPAMLPAVPQDSEDRQAWRNVLLPPHEGRGRGFGAAGRDTAWVGWLASLVVVAALVWAAVAYRAEVQRAWPPSIRLYTALGMHAGP